MALHEQSVGASQEWYTPPHVFEALGCSFDMDVASPGQYLTPWIPAEDFLVFGGLERGWKGVVWMNPPFGARNGIVPWLDKFFRHGNGIALTPDRTSAPWWQQFAPRSDLALFISPKLKFIGVDGLPGTSPAQGTTLLAAGQQAVNAIINAAERGLGSPFKPVVVPRPHHSAPEPQGLRVSEEALRNAGCPSDRRGTVGDCQDAGTCGCSLPLTFPHQRSGE